MSQKQQKSRQDSITPQVDSRKVQKHLRNLHDYLAPQVNGIFDPLHRGILRRENKKATQQHDQISHSRRRSSSKSTTALYDR